MDKVSIFAEALLKTTLEERQRYLDDACGNDGDLREEIDALLAAHDDAGSFLQKTPEELVATADSSGTPKAASDSWKDHLQPNEDPGSLGSLGHYAVTELIGRGGMGVVLRAHDPKLNRVVAIKMLSPELATDPVSVQRFLREAQAAAAVSHDHVVTIHAIDEEISPPIIVMECIEGKSLQQKIDAVGTLDLKCILRIGMQTASGLAAAHRQGLVHRDVKPANILLENGIERVKLTDFGLARAIDDISMTKTGTITGTPQYMSPEQAQGEPVDHRTDLFSLGCVLYAMCTGRAAFRADSAVAVMHCVVHQAPRSIRELNEDIPEWLCHIVDKLLAKNPEDRFSSAAELETLLSQHLAHLQQPESVPQPASVANVRRSNSERPDDLAVAPVSHELPAWFFLKIRPWMVGLVAVFALLVALTGNPERTIIVLMSLVVGLPLWLLPLWALTIFLRKKQTEAAATGQLYGGFAVIMAVGLVIAFGVPFLLLPSSTALLFAILLLLTTAAVLQKVRSESYAALSQAEGDDAHWGWAFAEKLSNRKPFLIIFGAIVVIGFYVASTTAGVYLPRSDQQRSELIIAASSTGLLAIVGAWLFARRRASDDSNSQRHRISFVIVLALVALLSIPYLAISRSPALTIALIGVTAVGLLLMRKPCVAAIDESGGTSELLFRLSKPATFIGAGCCIVAALFTFYWPHFSVPTVSAPSRWKAGSGRPPRQIVEEAFASRHVAHNGSSREPRDPAIDITASLNGGGTFVAFRGKLSEGFLRVREYRSTRTVSAPGVRAIAAARDKAAWVGDDGRPHLVSNRGHAISTSYKSCGDVLTCVSCSPNSSRIIAGGANGFYLWDPQHGYDVAASITSVNDVKKIEWSSNGDQIAVYSDSGLEIWKIDDLQATRSAGINLVANVSALDWSFDDSRLLVGDTDGNVLLVKMDTLEVTAVSAAEGLRCSDVAFSPDNIWIISLETNDRAHQVRCQVNPHLDPEFQPSGETSIVLADDYSQNTSGAAMVLKPDGSGLYTACGIGSYTLWEFRDRMAYSRPNARAPFVDSVTGAVTAEQPE